jgi:hypothetical protein
LFRDSVVTVSISEWDLTCNLFDGESATGPVPRLFAANPEEAHAALISDEGRTFRDLQRIMAKFFVPENIPPHKVWDFLNNIRFLSNKYFHHSTVRKTTWLKNTNCRFYSLSGQLITLFSLSGRQRCPSGTR